MKNSFQKIRTFVEKNGFRALCILIAAVILILGLRYTYALIVRPNAGKAQRLISVQYNVPHREMKNGSVAEQNFQVSERIEYFDINFFKNSGKSEKGQADTEKWEKEHADDRVNVELRKNEGDVLIQSWELQSADVSEGMNRFQIDNPKEEPDAGEYTIRMEFRGASRISSIGVCVSDINQYNKGCLAIDGKEKGIDLSFTVYGGDNSFLLVIFVTAAAFLLAGAGVILYFAFKVKVKMEKLFLLMAVILGIGHIFLMPAYSTPDERGHFSTAYYYSNILMGEEPVDEEGNVLVRNEDLLLNVENIRPSSATYGLIVDNLFEGSTDNTMVPYDRPPLQASFWAYLPQIIGITIARLLNMGNIALLLLSRLLALAFYTTCTYFAIRLIPFGKCTMLAVALLPMALEEGSSFSYDMTVNALSFLFIGYVLCLAYDRKGASVKDWIRMAVLMFFMAPIKVVYVLLAPLCLIIPGKKQKKYWIGTAGVVGAGLISCLLLRLTAIVNVASVSGAGSGGAALQTYTIPYILSTPIRTVDILYNTLRDVTDAILAPLFGQRLGYWDIYVPYYIAFGFVLVLLCSVIVSEKEQVYVKSSHKALMMLLCLGMIGGITLSMMLDFTDVSDTAIRGIQGRYFIPFLPLVLFLFRGKMISARYSVERYVAVAVYMLNYFTLWRIFETVAVR